MMSLRVRYIVMFTLGWNVTSCMQTENSSSLDAPAGGSSNSAIFTAHCTPCHSFQTLDKAGLAAAGLLIPGNAEGSKIYFRLLGSTGPNGPKNMPPTGALSSSDVAAIEAFINN